MFSGVLLLLYRDFCSLDRVCLSGALALGKCALLVSLAVSAASLAFLHRPPPTSCLEKDTTSGGPPAKIPGSKLVASSGLADHDAGTSRKVLLGKVQGLADQFAGARMLRRGQHHQVCHEGFHGRPDPSRNRATRGGKAQDEFRAGGDSGG